MLAEMAKPTTVLLLKKRKNYQEPEVASDGIRIHSVRLPGLIAHQEVILGQLVKFTLCVMTPVIALVICQELLAIRKVLQLKS